LRSAFEGRLIGVAMVLGAVAGALVEAVSAGAGVLNRASLSFFEGAGYALTHIVSLITCAVCFGKGIELCGLARLLGEVIAGAPHLLIPGAACLPLAFGCLCGSGMASTQSLFGFFVAPARQLGVDPVHVGAVVCLASASGRTVSPVAAVVLASSAMSGATVLELIRRVALPLLVGMAAVVAAAWLTR
jgi:DcuC family C4-dicarboxylate transporter